MSLEALRLGRPGQLAQLAPEDRPVQRLPRAVHRRYPVVEHRRLRQLLQTKGDGYLLDPGVPLLLRQD